MIGATAVCVIACLVLVFAEYRKARMLRIVAKCVASGAFIVVGMAAVDPHVHRAFTLANPWQKDILIGLVFGAIGDIALLGASKRAFMAGLVAFLIGHLLYVLASSEWVGPGQWLYEARPWFVIPIAVGAAALVWLWRRLGSMRVPVIIYVLVIVAMVVSATAMSCAYGAVLPAIMRHRFLLGAILFFVSDLAVARDKFVEKSFTNRAWGLPAYYAGQLLIAWSMLYPVGT